MKDGREDISHSPIVIDHFSAAESAALSVIAPESALIYRLGIMQCNEIRGTVLDLSTAIVFSFQPRCGSVFRILK